jgi:hypothetical protein
VKLAYDGGAHQCLDGGGYGNYVLVRHYNGLKPFMAEQITGEGGTFVKVASSLATGQHGRSLARTCT